ncbi:GHITM protein, partial [Pheucticus melanocephalus]|nr:GHITM protein [Pheucticus melanocephalus]
MLAARLVCLRALPCQTIRPSITQASPALRSSSIKVYRLWQPSQSYATRARMGSRRGKLGQDVKDAAFEPSAEAALKADRLGKFILAGGAAVGLGALCYYGMGLSSETGAIERA